MDTDISQALGGHHSMGSVHSPLGIFKEVAVPVWVVFQVSVQM